MEEHSDNNLTLWGWEVVASLDNNNNSSKLHLVVEEVVASLASLPQVEHYSEHKLSKLINHLEEPLHSLNHKEAPDFSDKMPKLLEDPCLEDSSLNHNHHLYSVNQLKLNNKLHSLEVLSLKAIVYSELQQEDNNNHKEAYLDKLRISLNLNQEVHSLEANNLKAVVYLGNKISQQEVLVKHLASLVVQANKQQQVASLEELPKSLKHHLCLEVHSNNSYQEVLYSEEHNNNNNNNQVEVSLELINNNQLEVDYLEHSHNNNLEVYLELQPQVVLQEVHYLENQQQQELHYFNNNQDSKLHLYLVLVLVKVDYNHKHLYSVPHH